MDVLLPELRTQLGRVQEEEQLAGSLHSGRWRGLLDRTVVDGAVKLRLNFAGPTELRVELV